MKQVKFWKVCEGRKDNATVGDNTKIYEFFKIEKIWVNPNEKNLLETRFAYTRTRM